MSICPMRSLLSTVQKEKRALGSFTVSNMEMVIGAVKAAEDTNTPIILQIAEARLPRSPLPLISDLMLTWAKNAKVEIGVHLDHGHSWDVIESSVNLGYTSVMFDGSHLPFAQNIAETKKVVCLAQQYGVDVEAELGVIGGNEGEGNKVTAYTNPDHVAEFCDQTGVTALAIAIGNAHGQYPCPPQLQFEILDEIYSRTSTPLVLHGGSGISDEEFRKAIDHGIAKINIATSTFCSVTSNLQQYFQKPVNHDFFGINDAMVSGTYECIKHHIQVFNNQ